jgi:hypothetical protein
LIEQDNSEFTIRLNLDNGFIQQLTDLINNVRRGLHFSRLFLSGDTLIDRSVCFQSDTASTIAAIRLFPLLPNMSLKRKFVQFDSVAWRHLFMVCGSRLDYDSRASIRLRKIEEKLWCFLQSLVFGKVDLGYASFYLYQYNRNAPPEDVPYLFDNSIRTDGHTVEFLFAKKKSAFDHLPDLKMPDLADENMDDFHIYGVDPGHNHLFIAVDEQDTRFRLSNNEWYIKASFKKRRREEQNRKTEEGLAEIESQIPSRKTASPDTYASSDDPMDLDVTPSQELNTSFLGLNL